MVIQNVNTASLLENTNYTKEMKASNDEIAVSNNQSVDDMYQSILKTISVPTKIYVDKVISNALNNIAKGNNVEDNKRIVRLFSNLIKENSENMLRKAYGL